MGTVCSFPLSRPHKVQIPRPTNYRPGDQYLLLEFDEPDQLIPPSCFADTKMYVRKGAKESGCVHAINTPDGLALSRLNFLADGHIEAAALLPGSPDGTYVVGELDIVGAVDQIYPIGWQGGSWSYNSPADALSTPRPVYNV